MTDAYHTNGNLTSGVDSRGSDPLEKDFSNGHNEYHLNNNMDPANALNRIRTTGSLSISPELFEKIYLSPQNKVAGDLRKTFGNPTPLALVGFLLCLTPLSCALMGWRGAGGNGAANIGSYYSFGGILMVLGAIGEWVIGNTFPFVVFGSFGAFWFTFGMTLTPYFNAQTAYTVAGGAAEDNLAGFDATFGFFQIWMGVLCFIYMICALRTNVVFVLIFAFLVPAFGLLSATYWQLAQGNTALAGKLQIAAGACTFVTCCCGWWIFSAIMLASLDFPFQIPVGDLSTVIKGASERKKARDLAQNESEYGLGA